MDIKKDDRDPFLINMELSISNTDKDPEFKLAGKWKTFLYFQDGYSVFQVDTYWVKNNLSVIFGHGGHGKVHEFIPNDEIWIGNVHFENCKCKNTYPNKPLSEKFIKSTVFHEITENKSMKDGKTYWEAHNIALEKEMDAGYLEDPYSD